MIVYVEHNADGDLLSIVEVHTTEGRAVEQELPGMTAEQRAERQARVDKAVADREAETRAALAQAVTPHAGLVVMPKGANVPTHAGHRVDPATGKVRARTAAERKAWADARAAEARANAGPPP